MRCQCCNRNLSDYEAVLKHPITMNYLDICMKCLPDTGIVPVEPARVMEDHVYEDDPSINVVDENEDDYE